MIGCAVGKQDITGVWGEAPTSRYTVYSRADIAWIRGSVATLPMLVILRYACILSFLNLL